MHVTVHAPYQQTLSKHLAAWQKRRSRALSPEWLDATLILLRLNPDPLVPMRMQLYSTSPRGRPPYDPLAMFRALLLLTLLRYTSRETFALALRQKPRLAIIAGFQPFATPAVGTFYLFMDRLEDGPSQPSCPHRVKPSALRKGQHRRNLAKEKAAKEAARKHRLAQCDSITAHLTQQVLASASQPRPDDLQKRLEDALMQAAVLPSAGRGLLGALDRIIVCGDGSALPTGASATGKPACTCRAQGLYRCECDRFYSDPTADWGYDAYHDCYYFGHTYYQHCVSSSGHDLPVHLMIGPASETDFTLSIKSLDRFPKACAEHTFDVTICAMGYDAGHDAIGNYDFLVAKHMRPLIALNPRHGVHPKPTGTAERVNAAGVPLCPAGLERRRHTHTSHRIIYNCPVKRPTHHNGKHCWQAQVTQCPRHVLCEPTAKMGPLVFVRSDADPRFYPEIARDSQQFKEIMCLRSGCERSHAIKKTVHQLGKKLCRSATHFLVRLYLVSSVEHAKAWLADDRKTLGEDWRGLSDLDKRQQLMNRHPAPG
jgi:Transposase domain (DUF772)/Transposase DDE domain